MATTYSTTNEVRASYPQIDSILPASVLVYSQSGSASAPLASIYVSDTNGFPRVGEIQLEDTNDTFWNLTYTGVTTNDFLLTAGQSGAQVVFPAGAGVSAAPYMIDQYRQRAKSVIDTKLTNTNITVAYKKTLEIDYTFYLATKSHHDPDVRMWGSSIQSQFEAEIALINKANPPAIRQTICKLVEDSLESDEISELKFGPDGDQ